MAKNGFITAIITGRKNGTVDRRATDLRVTEVYQGVKNKLPILEGIMNLIFLKSLIWVMMSLIFAYWKKLQSRLVQMMRLAGFKKFAILKQKEMAEEGQCASCATLSLMP